MSRTQRDLGLVCVSSDLGEPVQKAYHVRSLLKHKSSCLAIGSACAVNTGAIGLAPVDHAFMRWICGRKHIGTIHMHCVFDKG